MHERPMSKGQRSTMKKTATRVSSARCAAVIAFVLALVASGILPAPASAQFGNLVVAISAPTAGSTVTGTITVSASVTVIGALTVQSVQFKLDGPNLGAADATAPYAISWDTR